MVNESQKSPDNLAETQPIGFISAEVRAEVERILEGAVNLKFTVDGITRHTNRELLQLLRRGSEESAGSDALSNAARLLADWAASGVDLSTSGPNMTIDFRNAGSLTDPRPEDLVSENRELADKPIPVRPGLDLPPHLIQFFREADYLPLRSAKGCLSLSTFMRCSLRCVYCYASMYGDDQFGRTEQVFQNHDIVNLLLDHPYFQADTGDAEFPPTPIGINTSSSEAFSPQAKESTFELLRLLDKTGIKNSVTLITKYFLTEEDVRRLEEFENIRITIMVCFSSMPEQFEPVTSTKPMVRKRKRTLELLSQSPKIKVIHAYRPIAMGWNDSDEQIEASLKFGEDSQCIIIGGITLTDLTSRLQDRGLTLATGPQPGKADGGWEDSEYKKVLPPALVERILETRDRLGIKTPLVRRQSCGISLVHSMPDYNAHNIVSAEKNCLPSCPEKQRAICGSTEIPDREKVERAFSKMGWRADFSISPKEVAIEGLQYLRPDDPDRTFDTFDAFALRHLIRFPVRID